MFILLLLQFLYRYCLITYIQYFILRFLCSIVHCASNKCGRNRHIHVRRKQRLKAYCVDVIMYKHPASPIQYLYESMRSLRFLRNIYNNTRKAQRVGHIMCLYRTLESINSIDNISFNLLVLFFKFNLI